MEDVRAGTSDFAREVQGWQPTQSQVPQPQLASPVRSPKPDSGRPRPPLTFLVMIVMRNLDRAGGGVEP